MKSIQIINVTKGVVLAEKGQIASSFYQRLKGLLGRSSLEPGQALVLKPCSSIHTLFMRFTIDVLFLDQNMQVIRTVPHIRPFRLSPIVWSSQLAIELPAGTITQTHTEAGNRIEFK